MRSFVVAAAGVAAFSLLLSALPYDADARGGSKSVRTDGAKVAAVRKNGSCGTYMYWKAGRCQDARNKK